jgi:hypothetical protein
MSNRLKQRRLALALAISAVVATVAGGSIAIAGTPGAVSTSTSLVPRVLASTVPRVLSEAKELSQL